MRLFVTFVTCVLFSVCSHAQERPSGDLIFVPAINPGGVWDDRSRAQSLAFSKRVIDHAAFKIDTPVAKVEAPVSDLLTSFGVQVKKTDLEGLNEFKPIVADLVKDKTSVNTSAYLKFSAVSDSQLDALTELFIKASTDKESMLTDIIRTYTQYPKVVAVISRTPGLSFDSQQNTITVNTSPILRSLSAVQWAALDTHTSAQRGFIIDAVALGNVPTVNQLAASAQSGDRVSCQDNAERLRAFQAQIKRSQQIANTSSSADEIKQEIANIGLAAGQINEALAACIRTIGQATDLRTQLRALLGIREALKPVMEDKAYYGVATNYSTQSYENVFKRARRVVAMKISSDGGVECSGFALTASWVLTAGHCFKTAILPELSRYKDAKVLFSLDGPDEVSEQEKTSPWNHIVDLWPTPPPGRLPNDNLDYALVRIEPSDTLSKAFANYAKTDPPLEVCAREGLYRAPLITIGYPRISSSRTVAKTVHDHTSLWYPHRIDNHLYSGILADSLARAFIREVMQLENGIVEASRDHFTRLYRPEILGEWHHYQYDRPLESQLTGKPRPGFGMDSDTFSGNSGSPIFDRERMCLMGVFSQGIYDGLKNMVPLPMAHQVGIPIKEIVRDLVERTSQNPEADPQRLSILTMLKQLAKL